MKDRIIEMLERKERVSLECIDPNGFDSENPINKFILKLDNIIIKKAILGWVGCRDKFVVDAPTEEIEGSSLNENSFIIFEDELKYFKIKEPEYTFNDLIDVAVQAYKDGYIRLMRLDNDVLDISYNIDGDGLCGFLTSKTEESGYQFYQYIRDINSLYTETFVIESKEDMYRIGDEYEIVLSNGEDVSEMIIVTENYPYTSYGDRLIPVRFEFLKGATVTQKRGN